MTSHHVIHCETLIIDPGSPTINDVEVVVTEGRIVAIEHSHVNAADLTASVLMAGMIDSHGHITANLQQEESLAEQFSAPPVTATIRGVRNLALDLSSGVTTMRVLGDQEGIEKAFKTAIENGDVAGPQLHTSVRALRPSHGTAPFIGLPCDGPDELIRAIRHNFHEGADVIKLFVSNVAHGSTAEDYLRGDLTGVPAYSRTEIEVAVEEAHRIGMRVTAHAIGGNSLRWAVEAGIDSIEHGNLMTRADVDLMVEHGTVLSDPNLQLFFDDTTSFASHASWKHEWWREKVKATAAETQAVLSYAVEVGLPISLAVDSNHGHLWREAFHLVERLGADPSTAIAAVTTVPAALLGVGDEVGTVTVGKRSDLVALDANPLDDIGALQNIQWVMKGTELRRGDAP